MEKVIVIGCGSVADRWYLEGLKKAKYCQIGAIVDLDLNKARSVAEKYGVPYFLDYKKAIDSNPDIKIALVLTNHNSHYSIIKECLNLGVNVYSEKPFANNSSYAQELIDLAKSKGLLLCSAPQVMLSTRNQILKKLVNEKVIGEILMVRASASNMGPADREGYKYDPRWFYNDGGSLSSLGIYTLSIVTYIWGLPRRVCGLSGVAFPERQVMQGPYKGKYFTVTSPDNETALLEYENSMFVLFDGSYCVKDPVENEFIIHGTLGTIYVSGYGGEKSIIVKMNEEEKQLGPADNFHLSWNLAWGVDQMAQALTDISVKPVATADFAVQAIRVMEAVHQSASSGTYQVLTC